MIYITGDTHRRYHFAKLWRFAKEHTELTKQDYVIIAGDFGCGLIPRLLEKDLQLYSDLPFTILFVDGNHENFDWLNTFSVEQWNGGKVHRIRSDIIHLMRGQIYEIEGKTLFTFGGALSQDKESRTEGISWWKEEMPTYEEFDEAIRNLNRYRNKVDYVITHSCSERVLYYPVIRNTMYSYYHPETQILANIDEIVTCKRWYFGHFHIDAELGSRYRAIMHDIVKI